MHIATFVQCHPSTIFIPDGSIDAINLSRLHEHKNRYNNPTGCGYVTYNYFNQPTQITEASTTLGNPGYRLDLFYNATAGTDSMYYIHTDHLGSYCAITNASQRMVCKYPQKFYSLKM